VGMLTIDRLRTLLEAYGAAPKAGIHDTIQPLSRIEQLK